MTSHIHALFAKLASNGQHLQKTLQDLAKTPHSQKQLPPIGIERAAKMAGCTSNYIRDLEQRGVENGGLPTPTTIKSGSIDRRVYSLRDVNRMREKIGTLPRRPEGTTALTTVFINLKGGVAKTTSSVHFAQYAAREGFRVLLVDMDPQASATSVFGYTPDLDLEEGDTIQDAMTQDPKAIRGVVRKTYWDQLDLIPAQLNLQMIDVLLYRGENSGNLGPITHRFQTALNEVKDDYDLIVVDTPPAFGLLSINSIIAADYLIAPMTPFMYDISSSVQFFRILEELSARSELSVRRFNILISRHDGSSESNNATRMISGAYGESVLQNYMSTTREIQKSQNDQVSVYEIDKPRGNNETYSRALVLLDGVNGEILGNAREMWAEDQLAATQSKTFANVGGARG